jgi:hypothetical protein
VDPFIVPAHFSQFGPGGHIPEPDEPITAAAGKDACVRPEIKGPDPFGMGILDLELLAALLRIKKEDIAAGGTDREQRSVLAEREAVRLAAVAVDGKLKRLGISVPDLDRIVAGGRNQAAVRAEDQALDLSCFAFEQGVERR